MSKPIIPRPKGAVALYPIYRTREPNDPIPLFAGPFEVEQNGVTVTVTGEISLMWLRTPAITFSFKENNPDLTKPLLNFTDESISIRVPGFNTDSNAILLERSHTTGQKGSRLDYSGEVRDALCKGDRRNLSYVLLHLPNFHNTLGVGIGRPDLNIRWLGRFHLSSEEWKITVDKVENSQSLFPSLRASGGYAITHIVRIEKVNGHPFDVEEIESVKEDLFYFFSFARGFWVEPSLEVGFDKKGNRSWERWQKPRTDSWRTVGSWFDWQRPERLSGWWSNFVQRLHNPTWGETLRRALRWYMAANLKAGGLEGAIILAQTGHELLAWTCFVAEKRLTSDGFDRLPASDKLRLILLEAHIPIAVPTLLSALAPRCHSENWIDGPQAITFLRNKLVHPTPINLQKLSRLSYDELHDAHLLSMWYLELLLLFFLSYSDFYGNRLIYLRHVGEVELVPWTC